MMHWPEQSIRKENFTINQNCPARRVCSYRRHGSDGFLVKPLGKQTWRKLMLITPGALSKASSLSDHCQYLCILGGYYQVGSITYPSTVLAKLLIYVISL